MRLTWTLQWSALAILLHLLLLRSPCVAFTCSFEADSQHNDYGTSVGNGPYTDYYDGGSTDAHLVFSLRNCQELCCEHEDCITGVYNAERGICYLKRVSQKVSSSNTYTTFFALQTRTGVTEGTRPSATCSSRKGIVGNFDTQVDFDVLKSGINWWYNWYSSPGNVVSDAGKYVPMAWGEKTFTTDWPEPCGLDAEFLLGFNEPNFVSQANLKVSEAVAMWPQVMDMAKKCGIPNVVGPAVNYCGGSNCIGGTNQPVEYLQEFFAGCKSCDTEHYAVHIYTGVNPATGTCYIPYLHEQLVAYHTAFPEKKLWVTEVSCDQAKSASEQADYAVEVLRYFEDHVSANFLYRYSWFQAHEGSDSEGEAKAALHFGRLIETKGAGKLTPVGKAYLESYSPCTGSESEVAGGDFSILFDPSISPATALFSRSALLSVIQSLGMALLLSAYAI